MHNSFYFLRCYTFVTVLYKFGLALFLLNMHDFNNLLFLFAWKQYLVFYFCVCTLQFNSWSSRTLEVMNEKKPLLINTRESLSIDTKPSTKLCAPKIRSFEKWTYYSDIFSKSFVFTQLNCFKVPISHGFNSCLNSIWSLAFLNIFHIHVKTSIQSQLFSVPHVSQLFRNRK